MNYEKLQKAKKIIGKSKIPLKIVENTHPKIEVDVVNIILI